MPDGGLAGRYRFERRLARSLASRPPTRARRTLWSGIIQGGVKAQTGDNAELVAARRIEQFQRREAAVGNEYDRPFGYPTPNHQQQLPGAIGELVGTPSTLEIIALGRRQH